MDSVEMKEFKGAIEKIGQNWEELKKVNDKLNDEVKRLGEASGDTKAKQEKLEKALNEGLELKSRIEAVEAAFKRGGGNNQDPEIEQKKLKLEMKRAESDYLRGRGTEGMDKLIEAKTLSVNSDADGGYLVTPDTSGRVAKRIWETSPMRRICAVQAITTDALEGLIDIDEAGAEWVSETNTGTPNTKTPQLGKYRIPVHEQATRPKITTKLLEDANFDPAVWLATKVADKFARAANSAFVIGNGVGKPRGFTTYPAGAAGNTLWGTIQRINSGASAAITADGLINLQAALKDDWRTGAVFGYNRLTGALIRQLKDSQGRYYWQPSFEAGVPPTILGSGTVELNDMANVATSALCAVYANFGEAYQIVDRVGLSVLVDPYSSKPFVEYYSRQRVGGDVVNFDAIKLMIGQ
jgi:HK97 family phage major capsid protein